MQNEEKGIEKARKTYHHGDLREALIAAVFELVKEQGAENFSLADACRRANVSTAAPYKHFRDRDEILEIIVMRAFDNMADAAVAAIEAEGPGSIDSMVAMGKTYVGFAIENPSLFRLMFGQHPRMNAVDEVQEQGRQCFGRVIEQVGIYCKRNGVEADALDVATRLWTFAHGMASLMIDEKYDNVVPDLDLDEMLRTVTPMLLPAPSGTV